MKDEARDDQVPGASTERYIITHFLQAGCSF